MLVPRSTSTFMRLADASNQKRLTTEEHEKSYEAAMCVIT